MGFFIALGLWSGTSGALWAEVKMPAIFGDHMVLQQDLKLPVWGMAEPGEAVTVTVGKSSARTKAGDDGKWRVDLAPLASSDKPVTMTVTGKNSLKFEDVLVGEVWVCSGQSNMGFKLSTTDGAATDAPKANDPSLRLFEVKKRTAIQPVTELEGQWEVCTPETAAAFSAVGYYFGRDLRSALKRPVGMIGTYWGGTPAEAWTSLSGLKRDPELKSLADEGDKNVADFAKATEEYPAKQAAFQAAHDKWRDSGGKEYFRAVLKWKQDLQKAAAAGEPFPPRPAGSKPEPMPPIPPDGGQHAPATLFNGMVAPLIPYGIRGAIWYQGESNVSKADEYRVLFPRMISDWREKWGEGNFPFLFVQIAAFRYTAAQNAPFLREAQDRTQKLPNTGMATAIDVGNAEGIHPTDKSNVGKRLVLVARHVAYGEKLVYSGPVYNSMKVNGNAIQVKFTQTGGGLIIGKAPWVTQGAKPIPDTSLVGFTIAGADKKWFPAQAKIDGDTVVVSSLEVKNPVAVRYAWRNAPVANLYNKESLPAFPFRSDDGTEVEVDKPNKSTPKTQEAIP